MGGHVDAHGAVLPLNEAEFAETVEREGVEGRRGELTVDKLCGVDGIPGLFDGLVGYPPGVAGREAEGGEGEEDSFHFSGGVEGWNGQPSRPPCRCGRIPGQPSRRQGQR